MIAPLIIATWIVLASLVVALCRAARAGDLQAVLPEPEPAARERLRAPVSRPRTGRTAHGGSSFARAGGAAG